MTDTERYDILVLGSGEAGKYLAWTFARTGRRVAVVERGLIGGSCPNVACLPSKNVIHTAQVAHWLRRGREFGVGSGDIHVDMKGVRNRKPSMVEGLIATHLERYKTSGAELILGEGCFVAPKTVEIKLRSGDIRVLAGERVVIDIGTHSVMPDVSGLARAEPLTHVEALELDRLPDHLIVLGGGYVGLEFAQAMRRFGSRVTLVEQGPQIAPREDSDVSDALLQLFKDEGIEVVLNAQLSRVEGRSGEAISARLRTADGERAIDGSDCGGA